MGNLTDKEYLDQMKQYIESIKAQQEAAPDEAYKYAESALKRMGVINSNGTTKKKIVSWE